MLYIKNRYKDTRIFAVNSVYEVQRYGGLVTLVGHDRTEGGQESENVEVEKDFDAESLIKALMLIINDLSEDFTFVIKDNEVWNEDYDSIGRFR